jgi:hypothetical protein
MTLATILAALDETLTAEPRFPVEPPDGRKHIAELPRQTTLLSLLRHCAPSIEVRAIPNAGKRNPRQAKAEGIKSGAFDLALWWNHGHALIEMKGYDKSGRAGTLSQNQIDFGNRLHDMGWPVACFFVPESAVRWLAEIGAPVRTK